MEPIFIGCDHRLSYTGARSGTAFINDGTCTYSLALAGGAVVTSGSLSYVADSRGVYRATIDAAELEDLTEGSEYVMTITFSSTSGFDDLRTISYKATRRGAT